MRIPLKKIAPDPGQPRKAFDAEALEVLAASIQKNGLIQPITVRKNGKGAYFIVAGERRWRAHTLLADRGQKAFRTIEVIVREPTNVIDLRVKQIVENIARADLELLEEARAYAALLKLGLTAEETAERLGVSAQRVTSRVSLLNLSPEILQLLKSRNIDKQHALELARLQNHQDQIRILRMIAKGEIGPWKSIRSAVNTVVEATSQEDMFGEAAPVASAEELAKVSAMERKIAHLSSALASGWKDGECIIATKVSPDRASLMADQLAAIRQCVRHMEQQLRHTTAQARIVLSNDRSHDDDATDKTRPLSNVIRLSDAKVHSPRA